MKQSGKNFIYKLNEIRNSKKKELEFAELPTIYTRGRDAPRKYPPALAVHLFKERIIAASSYEHKNLEFTGHLIKILEKIYDGKIAISKNIASYYDDNNMKSLKTGFHSFLFDLLYAALQFMVYYNDEKNDTLYSLTLNLIHSFGSCKQHDGLPEHISHFCIHAALFKASAENYSTWSELKEQTEMLLDKWGEPPAANEMLIHAAINMYFDLPGIPNDDFAYNLIKEARNSSQSDESNMDLFFNRFNEEIGWETASRIVKILWANAYKSYYRWTKQKINSIKDQTKKEVYVEKIGYKSWANIPYLEGDFKVKNGNFAISFPGGTAIGKTSAIVKTGGMRIILDYGCDPAERLPVFSPDINLADFVFISHAHQDHIGGLLGLYSEHTYQKNWYSSAATSTIAPLVLRDSAKIRNERRGGSYYSKKLVNYILSKNIPLAYGKQKKLSDSCFITAFRAGHIAGSCQYLIESNDSAVVYSGDINLRSSYSTETIDLIPEDKAEKVTAVICEGTYVCREEDIISSEEAAEELLEMIKKSSKKILLPVLSLGRAQEILNILNDTDYRIFAAGMAAEITKTIALNLNDNIVIHNKKATLLEDINIDNYDIIVASAGCLQGGPSAFFYETYANELEVIITGYIFPGTPAYTLKDKFKIVRLSGHALDHEITQYISRFRNARTFLIHYPNNWTDAEKKGFFIPKPGVEYITS